MSQSHLPPEVIDYIIDLLRDDRKALGACCLVSKSWVHRSRRHIFDSVVFMLPKQLEAWKGTFPDPEKSPAHHVRSLQVLCAEFVTAEDGGWIRSFAKATRLEIWSDAWPRVPGASLAPFYTLSSIEYLVVWFATLTLSETLNLICSFPLLKDLDITRHHGTEVDEAIFRPSTSPPLTGTLTLRLELKHVARLLLYLPGGPRFRKIVWKIQVPGEIESAMTLVEMCSDTLECIEIHQPIFRKLCPFVGPQYFSI
jgi:hypothetical protein